MRASRCPTVVVLLLLVALPAHAAAWDVNELMRDLASVKRSEAEFVEMRHSAFLEQPLRVSGTLAFVPPDRLVKHSITPVDELFVVDGDELLVERKINGRMQTHKASVYAFPALLPLVQGVRSTLAGDLAGLERYYRVRLSGNPDDWQLALKPHPNLSGEGTDVHLADIVERVTIRGSGTQLRSIEVREHDGDRTVTRVMPRGVSE